MPVEIRELIIKAIISDETEVAKSGASMNEREKQELIETCVDQIFDILKNRKER
jgi:hypothetical protein